MQTQRSAQISQPARGCWTILSTGVRLPVAVRFGKAGSRQRICTVSKYSKDATNGVTKRGSGPSLGKSGATQQGSLRAAIKQQKVPSAELAVIDIFNLLATPLSYVVDTPWYRVLEAGLLIVQLAIVDAAYSGDWVRIGAITTETESLLQKVVWVIVSLHTVCGVAAAVLANQRDKDPLKAGFKGLLFGTLAIYEVTSPKTQNQATL